MYRIEFYEDKNGVSEVFDLLIDLEEKSKTSKDARIQHNQILAHIDKLRQNGTYNPSSVTKKSKATMIFGNCGLETIAYSTFITKTIPLSCSTVLKRNLN